MLLLAWLALMTLPGEPGASATGNQTIADAPGSAAPPVVGRPVDFSGAVGGPFAVEQTAEPTELTAEEPLTLTVRITGPGNLRDIPRLDLGKLEAYKPFAVEDVDDRLASGEPPRREFRYRLRPRTADVKAVPRLKFVYFNPRLPPARGYQTTYAAPVPLTVKPRTPPVLPGVPAELPEWMLEPVPADERVLWLLEQGPVMAWVHRTLGWFGVRSKYGPRRRGVAWLLVGAAILVPPLVSVTWFMLWRRANPDAARRAGIRRSRAAAIALRSLRSAGESVSCVATAVLGYLHDQVGLPLAASTPAEVAECLGTGDSPRELTGSLIELLRRCDQARFAPGEVGDGSLADDAERLILEWEAAPWSPPGC
jgi:hypothetical protein